jgi:hypothetical protein
MYVLPNPGPVSPRGIYLYGDSRGSGFVEYLAMKYSEANPRTATIPMSVYLNGGRVRTMRATVDADIAGFPATTPAIGPVTRGLYALGANDLGDIRDTLTTQAQWLSDAQYCLDAFRTKWSVITIYILKAWRDGYDTEANTYSDWVDLLIASRPTFTRQGPDERACIKGTNYLADGVHYTTDEGGGITWMTQQWLGLLGL